ncbi:hypothetical protein QBA35_35150 [Streptomyces bottropensis]|jgi:ADP-ribose pyrophosphatase YjhB (NUDIX family)|uniref:Nudix hydrolase domain-containing protein n=1 Tax=Streptomyces bottropensis TaxID=42235 RepID=A0ABU8AXR0_9ACTN
MIIPRRVKPHHVRVALVDSGERVLLKRHRSADGSRFWALPGCPAHRHEPPGTTAGHLLERLGMAGDVPDEPTWRRSVQVVLAGEVVRHDEDILYVRAVEVRPALAGELWCPLQQLPRLREPVYPTRLAELITSPGGEGRPQPTTVIGA